MGDEWRLREGRLGDACAVLELERGIAEAPHWTGAEYERLLVAGPKAVRRALFVAEADDGELLGFAVGRVAGVAGRGDATWGELESVAVRAGERRRGIGEALCEAVIGWCRDRGAERVDLEVRAGSAGAVALYEGLGFRRTGDRRGYYSEPKEDALLMELVFEAG